MEARCQCGQLSAQVAEGATAMTVLCHCLDCQRRSGSPFGTIAYFAADAVTVTGNAREFTRPTDEGNSFTGGFCPTCGSTVYAMASKYPALTGLTLGTLGDPHFAAPARSVFEQSRHPWVAIPDTMPRHLRGRDSQDVS